MQDWANHDQIQELENNKMCKERERAKTTSNYSIVDDLKLRNQILRVSKPDIANFEAITERKTLETQSWHAFWSDWRGIRVRVLISISRSLSISLSIAVPALFLFLALERSLLKRNFRKFGFILNNLILNFKLKFSYIYI